MSGNTEFLDEVFFDCRGAALGETYVVLFGPLAVGVTGVPPNRQVINYVFPACFFLFYYHD